MIVVVNFIENKNAHVVGFKQTGYFVKYNNDVYKMILVPKEGVNNE
jgi:hypothetical protein